MATQTVEQPVASHTTGESSVDDRSASSTGLLSKLATDVGDLMRTEAMLARSEINDSVNSVKTGLVALITGALVLLPGVLMILAAVALMLSTFLSLDLWLSTLVTGIVVSVIGQMMLRSGQKQLTAEKLTPSRTQRALEKDKALIDRKIQ